MAKMRVLIAYEERHHIYGDAVEDLLRRCRPHVSVINVPLEELSDQLLRFVPHLVVSSESNTVNPGGVAAWIELSPQPAEPSRACISGRHAEFGNPGLAKLLVVVDEAEELVQSGAGLRGC